VLTIPFLAAKRLLGFLGGKDYIFLDLLGLTLSLLTSFGVGEEKPDLEGYYRLVKASRRGTGVSLGRISDL
jgi:hypothetical protein